MSASDRQNRLLVSEDWRRIYQSFRNADFQSYDFENLRRVMISYIRENYPEDYNDYVESSEYLALIDLIAFLGQSLAFRTDLNTRENFLELAERRESVLRLARLVSYNPKRNVAASGLLKFTAVQTTQSVLDSSNRNLSGQNIVWNDPANPNWYEQFIRVINAALPPLRQFGTPDAKSVIYGIPTEQYRFQSNNTGVPIFTFSSMVDGRSMPFETTSTVFSESQGIYEEPPLTGNRLAFIYRNDSKGNSSSNTGFFMRFTQGVLNQGVFNIDAPSVNESIDIDASNINNTDVWLYRLDQQGWELEWWIAVPALEGNNIIYNSLNKNIKNVFSVVTRTNDRVSLNFSDGVFGNIPQGSFRVFYRTSNGLSYVINPKDIRNVTIEVPYVSNVGQAEVLSITLGLFTSVSNSSEAESSASIKRLAPAMYYTQNRMITGEDYNITPLSMSQDAVKIKAVNRTSSGISRYFDLADPTGKYSKTNLFADDGILYQESFVESFRFAYNTRSEIEMVLRTKLIAVLETEMLRDYYYTKYRKSVLVPQAVYWVSKTDDTNYNTGYFTTSMSSVVPEAIYTGTLNSLRYVGPGALVKFTYSGRKYWVKVHTIEGDGNGNGTIEYMNAQEFGPVAINDIVPSGAKLEEIIPPWRPSINTSIISTMVDLIYANKPFGLSYDIDAFTWRIITETNLHYAGTFSTLFQGDNSNLQRDASWLVLFNTDAEYYTVTYRLLRYVVESAQQVRFFFDDSDKIFDIRTGLTIKDQIKFLGINPKPTGSDAIGVDVEWEITDSYHSAGGYVDTNKIQVSFFDSDDDGIVDNPDIFEELVNINTPGNSKYVVLKLEEITEGVDDYRIVNNDNNSHINIVQTISNVSSPQPNLFYYIIDTDTVYQYDGSKFEPSVQYRVLYGRAGLKFQYIHNADHDARIDPGVTNIIDIYVLTKNYDRQYRQWLSGALTQEPVPPTTDVLHNTFANSLNMVKAMSDEIIYHPVRYKLLFGSQAEPKLRASFKIVKNAASTMSDNDVKTRTLAAINQFFNIENWDFGDSFYFSELSAYVMNSVAPNIVNFLIVPEFDGLSFGSLYEIRAESDQIFISDATVDNIEIISAITAAKIKSNVV